jgi:hypothetical protein
MNARSVFIYLKYLNELKVFKERKNIKVAPSKSDTITGKRTVLHQCKPPLHRFFGVGGTFSL